MILRIEPDPCTSCGHADRKRAALVFTAKELAELMATLSQRQAAIVSFPLEIHDGGAYSYPRLAVELRPEPRPR